jgi:curli biogenesis system outer membrane secretion channel CsgG
MNRPGRLAAMIALIVLTLSPPRVRADEDAWKPFLTDKKGVAQPVPTPITGLKDKDWLQIGYTDYSGFKPRLGVALSEEKTGTGNPYASEYARMLSNIYGRQQGQVTNPFDHIEDMVRQALGATRRFTMVERTSATSDVTGEQDFGASGRADKQTAAKMSRMKGADYIVKATIIELNPEKESRDIKAIAGGVGMSTFGIGSIGLSGKVAFCRLNVRLVNATTGEIAQDMTVDGTAGGSGLSFGAGLISVGTRGAAGGGAAVDNKKSAAISDAMQACANKIAYFVATKFEDLPWQGSVANVNGEKVIINAGANAGLKMGQILTLLSKGEPVMDPDDSTNVLGYDTRELGNVRIVDVQDRFATCEMVDKTTGAKRGDIVRIEKKK